MKNTIFALLMISIVGVTASASPTSKAKSKAKTKAEVYAATEEVAPPSTENLKPKIEKSQSFDAVPEDQVQPLLRRLKLVEALIQKHARAYDYRVITSKELEVILNSLERSNKKQIHQTPESTETSESQDFSDPAKSSAGDDSDSI